LQKVDSVISEACDADQSNTVIREVFTADDLQYLYQEYHSDQQK
jgi:hypothetical protein